MKSRNPIDSRKRKPARVVGPVTEEDRRKKAQKLLEKANFTPQAARFMSGVLRALAVGPDSVRESILAIFKNLSDPAFGD